MLVILEGTDLAGKTHIAETFNRVVANLGRRVIRLNAGQPEPGVNPIDEYELALLPYLNEIYSIEDLVVCDRWHLGELVYGPKLRGVSRLTRAQYEHIELFLDALGARRIVVRPRSVSSLARRFETRGEELFTLADLVAIDRWYEQWVIRHRRWVPLRSPLGEYDIKHQLDMARISAQRARHLRQFPGYVGNDAPRYLLVGDEPNGYVPGTRPNPAFMPSTLNSGHYLLDAIIASNQPDIYYGLCNANDGTDITALWNAIGCPRVVGLGQRAHAVLEELQIRHERLPHPQYVRRFRHGQRREYGSQIASTGTDAGEAA